MRFDRRISRRSFLAAAGATSAVLALTACGGSSSSVAASSASGTASSAAGTAQGGTLNIMLETEVQSLDPQVATDGTSFEVIADYTDGLMQMDADGAAVPAIAETYDISEDGKTYTFHLRDAKWSNGEAVTAADFVFGWQRAVDPATASEYSYMLSDIGQVVNAAEIIAGEKPVTDLGVTAVDDKTLEVQLNVPVSYFLSLMYFPTFYPVNEAFYNTCKDTFGTSPDTVLSNGAFKLTDYQPAATAFTLEKNPDYYDAGKIALDGLAYQVIKDSQQALMSYQTSALDMTLLNGEQARQQQRNEHAEDGARRIAEGVLQRLGQGEFEQRIIVLIHRRADAARDVDGGEGIGADQHEARLAEGEQSRKAVEQVHGDGDEGIDRALAQNRREHDGHARDAVEQEGEHVDEGDARDGQDRLQREAFFLFHMLLLRLSRSASHRTGPSA